MAIVVIKIGGSLLDLPDLRDRLGEYLSSRPVGERRILMTGGGAAVDWLRTLDAQRALGEEACHWLAVRAMGWTAHLIEQLLHGSRVVHTLEDAARIWSQNREPILGPFELLRAHDQSGPDRLPHSWDVTSDSIAAWVARRVTATELILLKSAPMPSRLSIREASRREIVDRYFPQAARTLERITCVNLRCTPPVSCRLEIGVCEAISDSREGRIVN